MARLRAQAAKTSEIGKQKIYEIAAAAFADHRTVERFIQGRPVKALAATRIRLACEKLGVKVLTP